MTGKTSSDLVNSTEAIAREFGVRFCVKCNLTRSTEGGRTVILNGGRRRWECASCGAKTSKGLLGEKK